MRERRDSVRLTLKGSLMSDRALAKRLVEGLANMERTHCTFWACDGPHKPRHMITCTRCWAIRDINVVLAALERRVRTKRRTG